MGLESLGMAVRRMGVADREVEVGGGGGDAMKSSQISNDAPFDDDEAGFASD